MRKIRRNLQSLSFLCHKVCLHFLHTWRTIIFSLPTTPVRAPTSHQVRLHLQTVSSVLAPTTSSRCAHTYKLFQVCSDQQVVWGGLVCANCYRYACTNNQFKVWPYKSPIKNQQRTWDNHSHQWKQDLPFMIHMHHFRHHKLIQRNKALPLLIPRGHLPL